MKNEITNIIAYWAKEEIQTSETDSETLYSYSADIIINDSFIVQIYGNFKESGISIPCADTTTWNNKTEEQDYAYETINAEKIAEDLSIESNFGWLEDNAMENYGIENKE